MTIFTHDYQWGILFLLMITLKVRKTQEGGLNCVFFFYVSPTDVTVQKQISISFWSSDQKLNVKRIKTE